MKLIRMLLAPPLQSCVLCNCRYTENLLAERKLMMLCPKCREQVHFIRQPICQCCGREMDCYRNEKCRDCVKRDVTYFDFNRSAVQFSGVMRTWIHTYKYHSREQLVVGLVELLYDTYQKHYRTLEIQAITFIPLHEERLYERRFNQAEQLAIGLAQKTSIPVIKTLVRTQNTEKQSHQSRRDRMHSITGAFQYIASTPVNKRILLIDDIYTTGSTLNEAAKILRQQGWEKIYTCTVARA